MGSTPVTRQKFSPAWRSSGVISFHVSFPVLVSSSTSLSRLKIGEPRFFSTDDDKFGWDLTMCGANDELKRRGDGKVGANARQTPTSPATTIPKCNAVVMRQYDKCSLFGLGGNISKRSARERESWYLIRSPQRGSLSLEQRPRFPCAVCEPTRKVRGSHMGKFVSQLRSSCGYLTII